MTGRDLDMVLIGGHEGEYHSGHSTAQTNLARSYRLQKKFGRVISRDIPEIPKKGCHRQIGQLHSAGRPWTRLARGRATPSLPFCTVW